MADVLIWHAQTGAEVEVPAESVWHYRQSGWITVAERRENEELQAQRDQQARAQPAPAHQLPPARKGAAGNAAE